MKNLGPSDDEDRFMFLKAVLISFALVFAIVMTLAFFLHLKGEL